MFQRFKHNKTIESVERFRRQTLRPHQDLNNLLKSRLKNTPVLKIHLAIIQT